jgi:translation elongation factor EF-1beta
MEEEAASVQKRLQTLGDPSGRQDSRYWDEWFEIVCRDKHTPFEWYCDSSEVIRVLSYYLSSSSTSSPKKKMVHAGSGTSLLPIQLWEQLLYPQVVVDISDIALKEMEEIHIKNAHATGVEYLQADVVKNSLPFDDGECSAWIDKAFIDAVFSEVNELATEQCRSMFQEAFRVLCKEDAVFVVISLSETHSLELIMKGYFVGGWKHEFHVWDLKPISGKLRPFAFVFVTSAKDDDILEDIIRYSLVWHKEDGSLETTICDGSDVLRAVVTQKVDQSREKFKKSVILEERKMLVTLEVKPYEAEANLEKLAELLQNFAWLSEDNAEPLTKPVWQAFENGSYYEIMPIAFGICKLRMKCIYPTDEVENLVAAIESWEGSEDYEDGIQSVDVDWANTFAIAVALPDILRLN